MGRLSKSGVATGLLLTLLSVNLQGQNIEAYPAQEWSEIAAADAQLDQTKIDRLFDLSFQDSATQGVVLIKNGLLVGERYADGFTTDSYGTSWSMAKSFYAALIGISIDRGEITSLDDPVALYLEYFNDERRDITLRDLLNMTSGLDFPDHEHEDMFFSADHLDYARNVGVEKEAGLMFEYNNVNSMLLADILLQATGVAADTLLKERIFDKIGLDDVTLWQDSAGNPLTYCCVDTTARQYARFGLLFARDGSWNGEQIISKEFVDETFSKVWDSLNSDTIAQDRGYSLHWWISRHDDQAVIFNASGKFGQYVFIDRANDIVFTRITKYHSTGGSKQDWGALKYVNWFGTVNFRIALAGILDSMGIIKIRGDIATPVTFEDGTSKEFFTNYSTIVDALIDISQP
ncbi:beta-lactamase family protein [Porticoccaceae bacterium]|jgi:CubicO group peptidase (beta-lactamase class C family)|nr:beta-lactamase family protein [Porticoccaceae bacterium]MDC0004580.1 beta-lactamase family protein [Porticoccaceae bacterium]